MSNLTPEQLQAAKILMQQEANRKLGIFASIKHVIISACNQLVKLCEVSETTLDAVHDVAKTGKVYTEQMKQEAELTANRELEELNAS